MSKWRRNRLKDQSSSIATYVTILHGTAFVFLKYPYSTILFTVLRLEDTSLVMVSAVGVILTTFALAFAMPNQAFGCPPGCVGTTSCACTSPPPTSNRCTRPSNSFAAYRWTPNTRDIVSPRLHQNSNWLRVLRCTTSSTHTGTIIVYLV
jgi:hypothetical protein